MFYLFNTDIERIGTYNTRELALEALEHMYSATKFSRRYYVVDQEFNIIGVIGRDTQPAFKK